MKKLMLVFSLALLVLSLASCSLSDIISDASETDSVQTVKSEESNLTLEFPKSWSKNDLNEIASVQMALPLKEQYLIVLEENAEDFIDEITLDEYAAFIMSNMEETIEVSESTDIKDVTINSISAKQFEVAGVFEKVKIKYFITCIEANGVFYQITAWSLQSKYDDAKPVFDKIIESIKFE